MLGLGPVYKGRGLPQQASYPNTHTFDLFPFFVFTRQLGLPWQAVNFFPVNTAGRLTHLPGLTF